MKKIYAPKAASELKRSRFSFVKVLSLATAATFLSNVTPVFSANSDFRNTFLEGVESAGVSYPENIISVAGLNASSKDNYLTALNVALTPKVNASDDYANFLTKALLSPSDESSIINVLTANSNNLSKKTLEAGGQYKKPLISPQSFVVDSSADQQLAQDDENADIINVSNILRGGSPGGMQRDVSGNNVIFGNSVDAKVDSSVVIGFKANAKSDPKDPDQSPLKSSVVIGSYSSVNKGESVAIGVQTEITKEGSVAIGSYAKVDGDYGVALGRFAIASREYSVAVGLKAGAYGKNAIAIGSDNGVPSDDNGTNRHTYGKGDYSIAVGSRAESWKEGAISIGYKAKTTNNYAVAFGSGSRAEGDGAITIGANSASAAQDTVAIGFKSITAGVASTAIGANTIGAVEGGVALGSNSVADRVAGVAGFSPLLKGATTDKGITWKSTLGAVSIGNASQGKTRQITGVAAGTELSDAANVEQVKSLQMYVDQGWNLSVGGANAKAVGIKDTVDLAAGSSNLQITKGKDDNKVKFDLAKDITLNSIKAGSSTLNATGLVITDGPKITTAGIHAGSKKITGVAAGTDDTDAVNFAQLKAVQAGQAAGGIKGLKINTTGKDFADAIADAENSVALGSKASVSQLSSSAIALGNSAVVAEKATSAISIGHNAKVSVKDGIALGSDSLADRVSGVFGYAPSLDDGFSKNDTAQWKSTAGVLSIGNHAKGITRQITGVSAGSEATDAVNVMQLMDLKHFVQTNGWKLSVGGANGTTVLMDGNVDFSTGNSNLQITKGKDDNKLKFDLAEDVALTSLKAGTNTLDATGLVITDGPKITTGGIDAGSKKITGIKEGALSAESTEAVTGSQLFAANTEIANVRDSILVKQAAEKTLMRSLREGGAGPITIGKETGGTEISILNKDNGGRKLSGLLDGAISKNSDEAVSGGQLHSLGSSVASYFGGGSSYEGGALTGPKFTLKTFTADGKEGAPKDYPDVAQAFAGIDDNFQNVNTNVQNIVKDFKEQVTNITQEVQGDSLLWGGDAFVAQHKTEEGEKTNSKIKFLAEGDITKGSTEAVTGGQLYTQQNQFAKYLDDKAGYNEEGAWNGPTFKVKTFNKDGKEVEETPTSVSKAFELVSNSFTNVVKDFKEQVTNITQEVQGDALLWDKTKGAFVAQHGAKESKTNSKITLLANGDINGSSSDAVAGNQLHSLGSSVASYFGGGAKYEGGAWTAPNFTVKTFDADGGSKDQDYPDVASAFAGVGSSLTNVQNKLTEQVNNVINKVESESFVQQDQTTHRLTIGAAVEGSEINIANKTGVARTLSGVGEATKDNEAVNKGQLDKGLKDLSNSLQSDESAVVHYDKKEDENGSINYTSVTLGGKDKTAVGLHNVADGKIGQGSHDAITGGQVNTIGEDVAKFLGGDAAFKDGSLTQPTYKLSHIATDGGVTESSFQGVGTAFAGLDSNIKTVNARIKEVSEGVAHDSLLWNESAKAFVAQHEKQEKGDDGTVVVTQENSKITSLQAGKITADSTDAVNGSQLHTLGTGVATSLGGGAKYESGTWTAPTFTVKTVKDDGTEEEKKYTTVAEAFADVGTSFTNIKNDITNVKGDSLVKWNEETKVIKIGGEKDGTTITVADKDSKARILSGVKDAEKGDEAVNKAQLDRNVDALTNEINDVRSVAVFYDIEEDTEEVSTLTRTAPKVNKNSVTFGDPSKGQVGLHNVAAGNIAKDSHDAVNGDQLHTVGSNVASYLGGSATFKDGVFTSPTYNISNITDNGTVTTSSYNDVGSAFAGLDASVKNVNTHLTNEVKKFDDKLTNITQAVQGDALLWSKTDKAFVAQHGEEGKEKTNSKITFLAAGAVSETSTDAVNGSQLHTLGTGVAKSLGGGAVYADGKWTAPTFTVKSVKDDGVSEDKVYSDVASALSGVGSSLTNVKNEITKQINNEIANVKGDSLVKKDATTNLITIGKEVEGSEINIANKTGVARTLSGVKEAANDNEAVNKGQLDKGLKDLSNSLQSDESAVVHYDKKDGKIDYANVTLGGKDKTAVGLHNVAAGKIAKDSHDAVNGDQLHSLGNTVATYFGGGSTFADGSLTAPTYKISNVAEDGKATEKSYNDVGSAFAGLDTSVKNVNTHLTNEVKKFDDKLTNITQKFKGDALLWSDTAHAFVAQHEKKEEGDDGKTIVTQENSKITSLQAGKITADSTDAVNGSQLYSLGSEVAKSLGGGAGYAEGKWTAPTFTVKSVKDDGVSEDKVYSDVASALSGVGSSITNVQNKLTEQVNNVVNKVESESFVQQDKTTHLLTIGAKSEGGEINIANKDKGDRTLSGVGEATKDNEAVNKGQLDKGLKDLSNSLQSDESAVVHYDKKEDENGSINYTSVTLGGKDKTAVGLHNVADGKIAKDSRDVITGGQVNTIGEDVAKFLGGNASFEKGIFKGPIYNLSSIATDGTATEKSYNDVGTAFAGLDDNIKTVNARIKEVSQGVAHDSLLWNDTAHAFVAQHEKQEKGDDGKVVVTQENSKITSLAAGAISETSTDAVNGSQLHTLGTVVATSLGGGAKYESGTWTAPTFTVKTVKDDGTEEEKKYNTVAEAFADVGTSFTNIKNDITNVKGDSLVKWNEEQKIIKIGGEKEGGVITLADNKNTARTLSGVKDAEKNDEAVNKGQLDENVTKLSDEIEEVRSVAVLYDEEEASEEVSTLTRTAPKVNKNSVTFGDPKTGTVGLHNVAAGKIAKDSHDAVNGDQLHTVGSNVASYLGGSATFADGSLTAPTYKISNVAEDGTATEKPYNDVGSAFAGLDTSVKNVNTHLTNVENKFTQKIDDISKEVKGDALLWNDKVHAFVAQHEKKEEKEDGTVVVTQENSKITSLAAGAVSETSTDAVNGSQLHALGTVVAKSLGGNAKYENGAWTAPTFKVKTIKADGSDVEENSYESVAEAFAGVGTSFTNIHNEINKEISKVVGDSLVKQDEKTKVINIGKEVEGSEINIANKTGMDRTLSGVQAATKDNEAVNKGQLDKGLTDLSNSLQSDESAVVHYDKQKDGKVDYANITLGGKDKTAVSLHNVADGKIAKDSRDVITGGQVNTIGEDVAKFLGGDAAFTNGALTQPTYKLSHIATDGVVTESSFQGVGTAFAGLDDNIKTVNARIKEVSEGVAHDSLLWSDNAHAFVAQHEKKEEEDGKVVVTQENSKITSLADGSIVAGSSDAVTGGQIYDLQKQFAGYLGGGAGYNEKGEWQNPDFQIQTFNNDGTKGDKKSSNNVAGAFNDINDSMSTINDRIKEVSEGVAQDSLLWNDKARAFVAQHEKKEKGDDGKVVVTQENSKITSLAAGAITKDSTDAVNGSQLFATNTEINEVRDSILVKQVAEKKLARSLPDGGAGLITIGNETGGSEISVLNKENGERKLSGLLGGAINETSDEAVTGSQLHTLGSSVASYFGGSASYENGAWVAPTFTLKTYNADGTEGAPQEHHNVTEAFAGIDKNFTNVINDFNEKVTNITESMQGDALLWNESEQAFVAQHGEKDGEKTNSKITSLTDGSIASGSSDAVNGGQLYSLNQTLAKYFGGKTKYEDGAWSEPTFTLKTYNADGTEGDPQEHHNVTEAFAGIDKNFTNVVNDFNEKVTNITESMQGDALLWNESEQAFVAQHGEKDGEKTNSKITSLADGSIASGSSDAVNGGQLYDLNQSLAKYFGGDAKYDGDGWVLPGFKLMTFQEDGSFEEEDYDSIAAAFAGINKVFKNLHNEISENIEQNALLWSDDAGAFVAQHEKEGKKDNSKITFLAEGKISEDSTDAINGGQIYTLQQSFASYFGGGAGYDKEGNWQGPKFYVQVFNEDGTKGDKEERNNVSEAFDVVNDSMSTINDRIKEVEKDVASNGLNWNEEKGSYDASHADDQGVKSPSKIINVEDGKVDKDSKEAVNGGQLWETQQMITDQVKDIETKVTEGSVQYDKDETGKKTNKVTLVGGDDSSPVLIDNVADGKIEKDSKEAVNGGQLHDYTEQQMKTVLEDANKYTDEKVNTIVNNGVNEAKSYTDMKFETLNYAIEDVRKEARQAAAIGLAVSNLRYNDAPGKLSVALGSGIWLNQAAFAIGAGYTSEDGNTRSSLSVTNAGGRWGVGVGLRLTLN
ncbi:YadA-like family protein [Bartonella grahamii]|nr:YadA-like family protein [Bartonella grahamii]